MSPRGEYVEVDPICVLDFYVDVAWQRRGVGIQLFQHLLQEERVAPAQLAYDRPSPKLFAFLKKHAGLTEYFPQPNRFVVFDAYFQSRQ
ncbi:Alpha-tubulin N-acetyltransferase [Phytophthora ramorum]|uniref:Alpha-tubulin N-acetyltransferase n=1 Tax=Phytophthora ramorum TaxID=164328 RepID=UPI0030A9A660|nr:Alpha-tubulin N-acetyltransferase [Phytophthora ramorum]